MPAKKSVLGVLNLMGRAKVKLWCRVREGVLDVNFFNIEVGYKLY